MNLQLVRASGALVRRTLEVLQGWGCDRVLGLRGVWRLVGLVSALCEGSSPRLVFPPAGRESQHNFAHAASWR